MLIYLRDYEVSIFIDRVKFFFKLMTKCGRISESDCFFIFIKAVLKMGNEVFIYSILHNINYRTNYNTFYLEPFRVNYQNLNEFV